MKIDPFAPVVVKSFDLSTDDNLTPILDNTDSIKEFKIEGKIHNKTIIEDNCVRNGNSGL